MSATGSRGGVGDASGLRPGRSPVPSSQWTPPLDWQLPSWSDSSGGNSLLPDKAGQGGICWTSRGEARATATALPTDVGVAVEPDNLNSDWPVFDDGDFLVLAQWLGSEPGSGKGSDEGGLRACELRNSRAVSA